MDSVSTLIDNLKDFERNYDQILIGLVKDREKEVIQMNTDQLFGGESADETGLSPRYTPSTIERKRRRNQPYDRVTLRDEGDFHASFFVRYGEDFFELASDDQKRVYLERKYGERLYGLTPGNIDRLTKDLKTDFVEAFRRKVLG